MRGNRVSGGLRPRRGAVRCRDHQYSAGCTELDCIDFHEQPDAQLLAYQRIIKQSGVVLAVYAPDLADGSAEDKAVSYALALGRPVMLIHPETLKTKWLNVPTEKAPG